MFGSGWRRTNHVVPFRNSLLAMLAAHLKGVRQGTLIDDSVTRFSTQVIAGADLRKGHSPSEILNRNERLFSAFHLFSPQRIWLKDSK